MLLIVDNLSFMCEIFKYQSVVKMNEILLVLLSKNLIFKRFNGGEVVFVTTQ